MDTRPVYSPDGTKILHMSDRLSPGSFDTPSSWMPMDRIRNSSKEPFRRTGALLPDAPDEPFVKDSIPGLLFRNDGAQTQACISRGRTCQRFYPCCPGLKCAGASTRRVFL